MKTFTLADLNNHTSRKDIYLAIKGNVYDVTQFLDEHPGGEEVLFEHAGKDATEAFEEIGHSPDAHALLKSFQVGVLDQKNATMSHEKVKKPPVKVPVKKKEETGFNWMLVPLVGVFLYVALRYFGKA